MSYDICNVKCYTMSYDICKVKCYTKLFFLALNTCNANLDEKDIAGSCMILDRCKTNTVGLQVTRRRKIASCNRTLGTVKMNEYLRIVFKRGLFQQNLQLSIFINLFI